MPVRSHAANHGRLVQMTCCTRRMKREARRGNESSTTTVLAGITNTVTPCWCRTTHGYKCVYDVALIVACGVRCDLWLSISCVVSAHINVMFTFSMCGWKGLRHPLIRPPGQATALRAFIRKSHRCHGACSRDGLKLSMWCCVER